VYAIIYRLLQQYLTTTMYAEFKISLFLPEDVSTTGFISHIYTKIKAVMKK
jgi:hypothetical protein